MILSAFINADSGDGKPSLIMNQTNALDEVQKVIEASYMIETQAGRDFDTSKFHEIFINDPRGGYLSQATSEFVKSESQDNQRNSYGYLDYKLAYYFWWKKGALRLEALINTVNNENRKMTKEEKKSLFDHSGRLVMPRLLEESVKYHLSFRSIEIKGDTAVAIFDDGPRTNQMIIVNVSNKWFVAGNKILSVHP